ncbi:chloride conductance regulatory protein ICln-like, partial [Curcuma longa]|uniref:chloride conductance regulatory protein ICln-like n=1 Tax=Curcuma longa TaxID=136217 RepID=UPI003D9F679E
YRPMFLEDYCEALLPFCFSLLIVSLTNLIVDTLFDIFCQCAELNPEPRQQGEEENTWFFGDEEMGDAGNDSDWQLSENPSNPIGYANGDHDLSRRVHELQIDSQQFEDADEGEQESHDDHHLAAN